MIVVENNDKMLFEILTAIKSKGSPVQCVYLPMKLRANLNKLLQYIRKDFSDPDGKIFICNDGDIFVLASGVTSKVFHAFKSTLLFAREEGFDVLAAKISRHTTDIHWETLIEAVKEKISSTAEKNKLEKESSNRQEKEQIRQNIQAVLSDTPFSTTIGKRRAAREHTVVMFVEDDPFQRQLLSMALDSNLSFLTVADGLACASQYVSAAPNILFLDIGLPDISGHELLKEVLKMDPDACVVMLSGNGSKDNVLQAINAGAKGFIGKPFTREKLMQYVEKYCTARREKTS